MFRKLTPDQIKERDTIIFGAEPTDALYRKYGGHNGKDLYSFDDLSLENAEKLVSLGYLDPECGHNGSPTARQMIEFAKRHSDHATVTFGGYACGENRDYQWVSIDTITVTIKGQYPNIVADFANEFVNADKFNINTGEHETSMFAWYD